MPSLLCICEQGYRASVEEQDDTVIWLTHTLQKAPDMETAILLRGSAVNYACATQQPVGVCFGSWVQQTPADLRRDIARYQADGGRVLALREDLRSRGLDLAQLISGIEVIGRPELAGLVAAFQTVSFW